MRPEQIQWIDTNPSVDFSSPIPTAINFSRTSNLRGLRKNRVQIVEIKFWENSLAVGPNKYVVWFYPRATFADQFNPGDTDFDPPAFVVVDMTIDSFVARPDLLLPSEKRQKTIVLSHPLLYEDKSVLKQLHIQILNKGPTPIPVGAGQVGLSVGVLW